MAAAGAHRGAPLANDEVYDADAARARAALGPLVTTPLPRGRPLLHAWSLTVPHPDAARGALRVRAPLPADLAAVVARLWPGLEVMDPESWPRVTPEEVAAAGAAHAARTEEEGEEGGERLAETVEAAAAPAQGSAPAEERRRPNKRKRPA